jgi:excisionase family DNA binding protein
MSDALLTHTQVAKRLRVRPTMVLRLIRQRRLAAVKVGRSWRIEPPAVDTYLNAHRTVVIEPDPPFVDDRQLSLLAPLAVGLDVLTAPDDSGPLVMTLAPDDEVEVGS